MRESSEADGKSAFLQHTNTARSTNRQKGKHHVILGERNLPRRGCTSITGGWDTRHGSVSEITWSSLDIQVDM
jgi:hypothetical protein